MADLTQFQLAGGPGVTGDDLERSFKLAAQSAPGPHKRHRRNQAEDQGEFSEYVVPRPELREAAFYGVLRDMVDAACQHSEAVPSTVALHILARFAVTIGRTAYINIGDEQRHLRMNVLIVGPTSKGRKGTSAEMPRRLFKMVDVKLGLYAVPVKVLTALATGEGLIHQVRDPYFDHEGKLVDAGVSDKRLLCNVSEFAGVLAQGRADSLLWKRTYFDHEDEVRLLLIKRKWDHNAVSQHFMNVRVDPNALFTSISFDPRLEPFEAIQREAELKGAGFSGEIKRDDSYQKVLSQLMMNRDWVDP